MSNSEERERSQQPPYIDPSLIIDTRLREVERQQREDKANQKKHDRSQRTTNWLLTIFTGLLFITSVASDILMLRYVGLTKQSADAAKSAADTASVAQGQIKTSGEETKTQVDRLIAQQQRTADAMERSLERSKEALDASIRISQIDQRAWISVEQMKVTSQLKAGEILTFEVTFKNSGKTPARDARIIYAVRIQERLRLPASYGGSGKEVATIGPGAQYIEHIRFTRPLTKTDVEYLESGIFVLQVSGSRRRLPTSGKRDRRIFFHSNDARRPPAGNAPVHRRQRPSPALGTKGAELTRTKN